MKKSSASKSKGGGNNDWTFIIYLAGDNNLSDDMISSIREIREITTLARNGQDPIKYDAKVAFVIEYDSAHPKTKTRRYVISKAARINPATLGKPPWGRIVSDIDGETVIEMNDEAPKTSTAITNLIKWGSEVQPADNYALIISGHSDAFQGRTLLVDENPPGVTTVIELHKAVKNAVQHLPKRKLDLIGFEGCVMNTLEVMYQFRDTADKWIGCQGSIPDYAWDYRGITYDLITNSSYDADKLTEIIVNRVRAFHKEYAFGGRSVDISACDLTKLDGLVSELEHLPYLINLPLLFAAILDLYHNPNFDFLKHPIIRILLNSHWKSQTFMHEQAVDLQDLCRIVSDTCQIHINESKILAVEEKYLSILAQLLNIFLKIIADKCDSVNDYIKNQKIITHWGATGLDYHYARGISIFFPWTILAYIISKNSYKGPKDPRKKRLEFVKTRTGKNWIQFLVFFLVLTQRPKGELSDALRDDFKRILSTIIKIFEIDEQFEKTGAEAVEKLLRKLDLSKFQEKEIQKILLEKYEQIVPLLEKIQEDFSEGIGGTRDDQIKTRGGIDMMIYYFGRYRNLRVEKLDLDVGS
jgi:hypothetical protein